jgi:APA family basic amino acid/polyamine antiporter
MAEKLKEKYGLSAALSMVVGIIIGVGIYFRTGDLAVITQGHVKIGLIAWIVGGLLTLFSALTIAELSVSVTETGGDISYAEASVGRLYAFVLGWGVVLFCNPSVVAIFAWVAAQYTCLLFGLNMAVWHLPVALVFMTTAFLMATFKPDLNGRMQVILTVIKLLPLFLIAVFGIFYNNPDAGLMQPVAAPLDNPLIIVFLSALLPIAFAYDSWIMVTTISGEIKNAKRNIPLALTVGISAVIFIYAFVYLGFINVLPAAELAVPNAVPFGIAETLFGGVGGKIVVVGIIISALGALNGFFLGYLRKPYSLGIKRLFPFAGRFSEVNEKTNTPIFSSVFSYILSVVFIFANYFGHDVSSVSVLLLALGYLPMYVSIIKRRKRGLAPKNGYRVPLFPVIPLIAILGWIGVAVGVFFIDRATTMSTLIGLAIYCTGLPVYFLLKKRGSLTPPGVRKWD